MSNHSNPLRHEAEGALFRAVKTASEPSLHGVGGWTKRLEDIAIATVVLIVAAVPMLCIALAIRLSSRGPVIFRQIRYGLNGREFSMWKFRTMTPLENERDVPLTTRDDSRVTRIGAFLRRTSLDELPQFLHVLSGTMSVVGPRPHASVHHEYYRRVVSDYMARHRVRPGITGWAQINGLRGAIETTDQMSARVKFDLWYIRNWSLLLDFRILVVTLLRGWRDESGRVRNDDTGRPR